MKEGPSLFSRAQGGVLCAPKNKKTKYYEIRRQGKTKLYFKYSENKLKFNLKSENSRDLGLLFWLPIKWRNLVKRDKWGKPKQLK
jgi:hypothetical protein